jgi:hypothetical protein
MRPCRKAGIARSAGIEIGFKPLHEVCNEK